MPIPYTILSLQGIKFKFIGPPQPADIIKASAADAQKWVPSHISLYPLVMLFVFMSQLVWFTKKEDQ